MKLVRCEYKEKTYCGIVRGKTISIIDRSFHEDYKETGVQLDLAKVRLLSPVVPSKFVCVGQNYIEHIKEIGVPIPEKPIWFLKPSSSLIGPGDSIIFPKNANRVDYEGELAIVIKTAMKNVKRDDALKYILGYCCFNDVTERQLATANPFNLAMSKSFDTFAALGPWIETELNPDHVQLKTSLNGKLMQEDNTNSCVFNTPYLLEYISHCLTLFPGDVISTGTPVGIAAMNPGDVVEVEIEGIGKLSNTVESEKL
jgi:2-keto-4-pentenoate hydratase/2-oxohepta-3-ene-1,7-dioic acid hydratase in catechol pathway